MAEVRYSDLKILVVEDEAYVRKIIVRELRAIGVGQIEEAENGRDGLMKVAMTRPDMVFCDIHMAPINGLEFLEKLRTLASDREKTTPVVFLTSDADQETVLAARRLSVDGYIVKPASNETLRKRINASLGRR
jgi:two-component system, chemotaxis family, chemotaxis protein CheY